MPNCQDDSKSVVLNKYHEMMKHNFTKPGIMIGFRDVSHYIYNDYFQGTAINHPTSMLNSDIIRYDFTKPPITQRCFVELDQFNWLWVMETDQTYLIVDGKKIKNANNNDNDEFLRLVLLPYQKKTQVDITWTVLMKGIRLKKLNANSNGLYFNIEDDKQWYEIFFENHMKQVHVHPRKQNNNDLYLGGVYCDKKVWHFDKKEVLLPLGLDVKLLSLNTDILFCSWLKFQEENQIIVFPIPSQISYDGCQYTQKNNTSINMFVRPMSPLVTQMPAFNLSIELNKELSNQLSVLEYHFPQSSNLLLNRKCYKIHRCFISNDLKHANGLKWVDIYKKAAKKKWEEMTVIEQQLFPRGRFVTPWKYDEHMSGVIADCVIVYYLPSIILDDGERYLAFGTLNATARANFKYGLNREFKFKNTNEFLCHYSNHLNDKVW